MRKFILYVILYVRSLMRKKIVQNSTGQNQYTNSKLSSAQSFTSTLMADFCQDNNIIKSNDFGKL